ncbi:MAG: glycosyltransferase family 2 protein [Candidatus Omnitrophota bacterium]
MSACDIVLTVYNQPELTQNCLESLESNFREGDRLIIIDNGSEDGTRKFLEAFVSKLPRLSLELVRLFPNQGFIKAANEGLRRCRNPFACLLSNDTVVTAGWLEQMMAIAEKEADIGIINPMSTTFGLYPKEGETIDALAKAQEKFSGQYTETADCVGFCMLIRKAVMDKIGLLDEVYGQGYFEDSDFSRRASAAGWRAVIAKAAYVWHREHSTFQNVEREEQFKRNREIFWQRWGKPERILCVLNHTAPQRCQNLCLIQARQGNWVWAVSSVKSDAPWPELHTHLKFIFHHLPILYAFFILLVRRKKRFDAVVFPAGRNRFAAGIFRRIFKVKTEELIYERQD